MVWAYSGLQVVVWPVVQCIFVRFRRAPLLVLGILLCSAFLVSLVYRVWLGFSLPPFPPGSVRCFLLSFGVGVSVMSQPPGSWVPNSQLRHRLITKTDFQTGFLLIVIKHLPVFLLPPDDQHLFPQEPLLKTNSNLQNRKNRKKIRW